MSAGRVVAPRQTSAWDRACDPLYSRTPGWQEAQAPTRSAQAMVWRAAAIAPAAMTIAGQVFLKR
jgi:hypothetical protein